MFQEIPIKVEIRLGRTSKVATGAREVDLGMRMHGYSPWPPRQAISKAPQLVGNRFQRRLPGLRPDHGHPEAIDCGRMRRSHRPTCKCGGRSCPEARSNLLPPQIDSWL